MSIELAFVGLRERGYPKPYFVSVTEIESLQQQTYGTELTTVVRTKSGSEIEVEETPDEVMAKIVELVNPMNSEGDFLVGYL